MNPLRVHERRPSTFGHNMKNDSNSVCLGQYEMPDAKRIIAALEQAQIQFDIEEKDIPTHLLGMGSFGQLSRIKIWVLKIDRSKAQTLQGKCLNIEI